LETWKAQFQLIPPSLHSEFEDDFNHGIKNIKSLQKIACKEGPGPEHFVVSDGGKKALKLSLPLFEKRVGVFFKILHAVTVHWYPSFSEFKDLPYDCKCLVIRLPQTLRPCCSLSAMDEEDWSNDYLIAPKYRDTYDDIVLKWQATPLPAFDASGKFIKIHNLEDSIRGSLALVYF
jgi:hypothetical protein